MVFKELQKAKQPAGIDLRRAGNLTEVSAPHPQKQSSPIDLNSDGSSIETNDLHPLKQLSPILFTV